MIPAFMAAAAGLGSAFASWHGARSANRANRDSAREQMAFQDRMSSTAYQRGMEDMRKAGLNPILAYSKGGASSPTGASYQSQNELENVSSSAMSVLRSKAELKNLAAQNDNLLAQADLSRATARKTSIEAAMIPIRAQREKALDPLYDVGGSFVSSAVDTGRKVKDTVSERIPVFMNSAVNVGRKFKEAVKSPYNWYKNWRKGK